MWQHWSLNIRNSFYKTTKVIYSRDILAMTREWLERIDWRLSFIKKQTVSSSSKGSASLFFYGNAQAWCFRRNGRENGCSVSRWLLWRPAQDLCVSFRVSSHRYWYRRGEKRTRILVAHPYRFLAVLSTRQPISILRRTGRNLNTNSVIIKEEYAMSRICWRNREDTTLLFAWNHNV